ncbi:hypothetical protein B0O80DRAFT_458144 [Mortierella sp. GBAus27b]|nr:hypothetical protein B0O80DRAFT_458144 [Mortierella sp. GBAus27b]
MKAGTFGLALVAVLFGTVAAVPILQPQELIKPGEISLPKPVQDLEDGLNRMASSESDKVNPLTWTYRRPTADSDPIPNKLYPMPTLPPKY